MTLTKILTALFTGLLLTTAITPLSRAQEPKSLEEMLNESNRAINAKRSQINALVKKVGKRFRSPNIPDNMVANLRRQVVVYGLAASTQVVEEILASSERIAIERLSKILYDMNQLGHLSAEDATAVLMPLLNSKNALHKEAGVSLAGYFEAEDLRDPIAALLSASKGELLAKTLVAMAQLQDDRVFEHLALQTKSPDKRVRLATAYAYALIGRESDYDDVLRLVEDNDYEVALYAIAALPRAASTSKALKTLHRLFKHDRDDYVLAALEGVERINKREYSRDNLKSLCMDKGRSDKIRKAASIVLFKMGDSSGRDELVKPYKLLISRQPKRASNHVALAEFYIEFSDWDSAVKSYKKAVTRENNNRQANRYRENAARCYARWERFGKAAAMLKDARGTDWENLADDPAFAEMKKLSSYRKYFVGR